MKEAPQKGQPLSFLHNFQKFKSNNLGASPRGMNQARNLIIEASLGKLIPMETTMNQPRPKGTGYLWAII